MSKRIDISGQVFGRLTAREFVPLKRERGGWLCTCSCGNETIVDGHSLRSGKTKSCGCLVVDTSREVMKRTMGRGETSKNFIKNRNLVGYRQVIASYKVGAKNRGLQFSLEEDFAINILKRNCYYCNSSPSNSKSVKITKSRVMYSGIDRIDNAKGYTEDNVVPCCAVCNKAKNTLSIDEFLLWIRSVFGNRVQKEVEV